MLRTRVGTILLGAVAIAGLTTGQANAVDTTVTFTATGGSLAITAAPSATLTGGTTTPGGTVSGSLGLVTVTDSRGTAAGWTAGVYSTTGFTATSNPSITNASVTYTPGSPTTTAPGTPTVTPGTAGSPGASSGTALTAYAYANATAGGNIVSWNPTLAVLIPSTAAAGAAYSGTVSHQVA